MTTRRIILTAALTLFFVNMALAASSTFLIQATIVAPVNASLQTTTVTPTSFTASPNVQTNNMQLTIAGPAERPVSVSTSDTSLAVCTQGECAGDNITVDNIRLQGDLNDNGNGITNTQGLITAAMTDNHVTVPDNARSGHYTANTVIHIAFA